MKKSVLAACLALLSCVTLASCGSIKSDSEFDDKVVTLSKKKSKILTDCDFFENGTLTTYTPNGSIINYFSVDSYIKYLGDTFNDNFSIETKDGILKVIYEEQVGFTANAKENTISPIWNSLDIYNVDFGSLDVGYESETEFLEEDTEWTIDLDDYEMDIIYANGEVLLPGNLIMYYLLNGLNLVSFYNGNNYIITDSIETEEQAEMLLSGSRMRYVFNEELYKYNYNFMRLVIDELYGLKDYYSYDSKIVEKYKDDLLSKDNYTRINADISLLSEINEGHTVITGFPIACYYGFNNFNYKLNEFYNNYYKLGGILVENRGENFKDYVEIGDTAFVTIDTFYIDENQPDDFEENTHTILKNSLAKASTNANIKNVVVNLAGNGGGYVVEEYKTLGLLFNDDIVTYINDVKSKAKQKSVYKIDADGDGDYTDNDSYEGMFNFYILTSPLTFSAGNTFTCYCKTKGIKTIGQKTGGGACMVGNIALPDGTSMMFSSLLMNYLLDSNGNTIELEAGATPDIEITDFNKINDFEYIYTLIH